MNPSINEIIILKDDKREMCDHGDMLFYAIGKGYDNGCYVRELVWGTAWARDIIRAVGLSTADIRWIEKTAKELFKDKRNSSIEINMKTMKMRKY